MCYKGRENELVSQQVTDKDVDDMMSSALLANFFFTGQTKVNFQVKVKVYNPVPSARAALLTLHKSRIST